MYNQFSSSYDRFVNWPERLAFELPFIEKLLQQHGVQRLVDAACGTGQHVLALAQHGYAASGADYSAGMIEQARLNSLALGISAEFKVAGFGELDGAFAGQLFDAVLCLGNSLPHILGELDLLSAFTDFAAVLKPGGLLILQNRNFDAVMAQQDRWIGPQATRDGDHEWTFVRFYDFLPDGLIDFNIVELQREGAGTWQQRVMTTQLKPWLQADQLTALQETGFTAIVCYGGLDGSVFNPAASGNLVVTAIKA